MRYKLLWMIGFMAMVSSHKSLAAEPKSLWIGELVSGRPADFYVLQYARNRSTCAELLSALNEPWKTEHIGIDPEFSIDVLLRSRLSVSWTSVLINPLPISSTVVDLNNDGTRETIYRRQTWLAGWPFWALFWADVDSPASSAADIENLLRQETNINVSPSTVKGPPLPGDFPQERSANVEIATIQGKNYLLLAPYLKPRRVLEIALLQVRSKDSHSVVCLLRSAYRLRKER